MEHLVARVVGRHLPRLGNLSRREAVEVDRVAHERALGDTRGAWLQAERSLLPAVANAPRDIPLLWLGLGLGPGLTLTLSLTLTPTLTLILTLILTLTVTPNRNPNPNQWS